MNNNMNKKPFFDRRGKSGIYSVVLSLILLAVLIVVNLIVGSFPAKYTMLDTTDSGQYEISGTTESFLAGVKQDVTVYYIVPDGYEDATLSSYLERYASLSQRITLKSVDPLENPAFLDKYNEFDDLSQESGDYASSYLLVESAERYRVIHTGELYTYGYADLGYSGLSFDEAMAIYQQYYYYGIYPVEDGYCFDSKITGAIEYVCAELIPSVYLLGGHGEEAFSDTVASYLADYGIEYKELNLALDGDSIPEDCTCIIIHKPTSDLTRSEANKLADYVAAGGNIFLMTDKGSSELANLMSLTAEFGLTAESGTVSEGDSSKHVTDLPGHIYPSLDASHATTSILNGYKNVVLLANAQSIKTEKPSGYKITELLYTSDKATVNGGAAGKKVLAAASEGENGGGKLIWVASPSLTNDSLISKTSSGNAVIFISIANSLISDYISVLPEIESIAMTQSVIATTATDANIWGTILIFIVPGATLGAGIGYTVYRRRR